MTQLQTTLFYLGAYMIGQWALVDTVKTLVFWRVNRGLRDAELRLAEAKLGLARAEAERARARLETERVVEGLLRKRP
jgi:hypothetical protein